MINIYTLDGVGKTLTLISDDEKNEFLEKSIYFATDWHDKRIFLFENDFTHFLLTDEKDYEPRNTAKAPEYFSYYERRQGIFAGILNFIMPAKEEKGAELLGDLVFRFNQEDCSFAAVSNEENAEIMGMHQALRMEWGIYRFCYISIDPQILCLWYQPDQKLKTK